MTRPEAARYEWLRSWAYDVLCLRDGFAGWRRARAAFRTDRERKPGALAQIAQARLRGMLCHAFRTSPHYAAAWKATGFDPDAPDIVAQLELLPFITKDDIRERKSAMVSRDYDESVLRTLYTGGTTGTQTPFFLDRACVVQRFGRQWGALELCGYRPGMRRGLVWGAHVDLGEKEGAQSLRQSFREFAAGDVVLFCGLMNTADLRNFHKRARAFKPDVLYGYPSALAHLGELIDEEGLQQIRVGTVITTAERLTESRRRKLEHAFGGKVFNLYCTREYGCIGHECYLHRGLHLDTGALFVEIIKDGRRVPPGEKGEITITDLINRGMPFVRSRTGDLGALSAKPCVCGSPFPLLESLDGRVVDAVRRPDGSTVSGLILADALNDIATIRFAQFVQQKRDALEVRIVSAADLTLKEQHDAILNVRALVGDQMTITISRLAEIPRSDNSGKVREVISLVTASGDQ